ncbi:unnamed protein product [Adineta steineri]|uniref:C3H1-type domain-containing protein n=1 Tax=Adineta steineri TaxID=433720 RepID=A0A814I7A6_9BILA|nr:unnamed protein product [Adineta steineri]
MYFEDLANELILNIFEYLDIINCLHACHNLNSRLNYLLVNHHSYNLDFRNTSKYTFDNICQQYIPLISHQITSLHLSDNEETPNLPKLFLFQNFSINQFFHLQSISLYSIQSFDILHQIITHCNNLLFLTHLNLIKCNFYYPDNEPQCLIDDIWRLSKLTHCILHQNILRKIQLTSISVRNLSMKYLILENITCDMKGLSHLLQYTPCLQRITLKLMYGFPNQQLSTPFLSITSLKLVYHGHIDILMNLFHNTPNLISLTLETSDIYCNGYQWEEILINSLCNCKIFRLKMNLHFRNYDNINEQVDELLETFRTSFWIEEHQWFVRCDWNPLNLFHHLTLYTLPYTFKDCFNFDAISSKSTCPNDIDYCSYDHVPILSYINSEIDLTNDLSLFSVHFPNIHHLNIHFPFHDNFWSCLSSLKRLTSIEVRLLHTDIAYFQLQKLLNQACHLYSLNIYYSKNLSMRLFTLTSSSIRRLDFIAESTSCVRYFNHNECNILINAPLGRHCEILIIGLKNRSSIVNLISAMPTLRSLICHCKDDEYTTWNLSSVDDELIEWLRIRLPLTYEISRNEKQTHLLRLWIDQKIFNNC